MPTSTKKPDPKWLRRWMRKFGPRMSWPHHKPRTALPDLPCPLCRKVHDWDWELTCPGARTFN